MKVIINQLEGQRNADVQLKKENQQLHRLVNKYHESKNAKRISVGSQTIKYVRILL